ncbi:unnamed protein product, partial [Mesorhabditis belari]|uniref:Uncharacterized protein n=1 Tax=Mesorhabditis belari TaxID=2138241 RepID=A0AAF3E8A2_9BILA
MAEADSPCSPFSPISNTSVCGFSLLSATITCCVIQIFGTLTFGILYQIMLSASPVVTILLYIHIFCSGLALAFLILLLTRRKFGSFFEVLLHAFLLSVLLTALASLFSVMYLPLSFLQQTHSVHEGLHYLCLLVGAATFLGFQFFLRNLTEQMLPYMEHHFR